MNKSTCGMFADLSTLVVQNFQILLHYRNGIYVSHKAKEHKMGAVEARCDRSDDCCVEEGCAEQGSSSYHSETKECLMILSGILSVLGLQFYPYITTFGNNFTTTHLDTCMRQKYARFTTSSQKVQYLHIQFRCAPCLQ